MDRRRFLLTIGAVPLVCLLGVPEREQVTEPQLGPPLPFDFDTLRQQARALSMAPYKPPILRAGNVLKQIDFDAIQKIRFKPEATLWSGEDEPFTVRFFHLNKFVTTPVTIYAVERGLAREVQYSSKYFDYDHTNLRNKLPEDLGYGGFRIMSPKTGNDWLAFQGASYFRSSGASGQYGLSARGIAVNTAMPQPEEFPRFSSFWLERPTDREHGITIYALLDGPSLTGAYRFACSQSSAAVMDVQAVLFMRQSIKRLGIAPLTSMFWYGENNRTDATDWRPEIHDSDGLALWTGAGERIWRPLNDPPALQVSSFEDKAPKGFGLLQRDRNFDHYQDDSTFYNARPSAWVEPRGDWGKGAVQLVEIPTNDEIHDNIVAYWLPEQVVEPGSHWNFDYRLYWASEEPFPPTVGHVVATRIGRGGVPGQETPRKSGQHKFVIDFEGGPLFALKQRYDVDCVVTASRGNVMHPYALKVVGTNLWRATFDLDLPSGDAVVLRCFLRLHETALTETWLYEYIPPK